MERLTRRPEPDGFQIVLFERAYRQTGLGFGRVMLDGIGHLNPRAALARWPASSASLPAPE